MIALGAAILWEAGSGLGWISPLLAPAPSAIAKALIGEITTGDLAPHVLITLYRVVSGIVIGGSFGAIAGMLLGMSQRARDVTNPFISAIHPIPKIAILPVLMVVLGIGDASRIAAISLAVFFPMMINTMNGVRQINPTHLDVARNYGASGVNLFRRIVLPASLPMILSGLRIGVNLALLIAISVEIAGANLGLGSLIWISWEIMRIDLVYASLVVIMLLGISLNVLVGRASDALAPWLIVRHSQAPRRRVFH
jgi:NitT/TauT family transport system permease protein